MFCFIYLFGFLDNRSWQIDVSKRSITTKVIPNHHICVCVFQRKRRHLLCVTVWVYKTNVLFFQVCYVLIDFGDYFLSVAGLRPCGGGKQKKVKYCDKVQCVVCCLRLCGRWRNTPSPHCSSSSSSLSLPGLGEEAERREGEAHRPPLAGSLSLSCLLVCFSEDWGIGRVKYAHFLWVVCFVCLICWCGLCIEIHFELCLWLGPW